MRVLITGADGFLGRNLRLLLSERSDIEALLFTRQQGLEALDALISQTDCVMHFAGVNRPRDPADFKTGNTDLTRALCESIERQRRSSGRTLSVIYTSSTQATSEHAYGQSKRLAEDALRDCATLGHRIHLFRLPNVFGKWCRPNYNSAVATFCYNVARDLPIQVNDPQAPLTLVHIDDLMRRFVELLDGAPADQDPDGFERVYPTYITTVGEVANMIRSFRASRESLITPRVGEGLVRALYSTYVSHLPPESFDYPLVSHADARGVFVEMLKTPDCGQFSYFTAHPGITRGGHYHHSKTEKFLVLKGQARFKFRHMDTGQTHELVTSGDKPRVVETVPGWTHDITNIGAEEMIVMLWANELFDRARPDTQAAPL